MLTPFLSVPIYSGVIAALNQALVTWQIHRTARRLGLDDVWVIVIAPTFARIAFSLNPRQRDRRSAIHQLDLEGHELNALKGAKLMLAAKRRGPQ